MAALTLLKLGCKLPSLYQALGQQRILAFF
jgi:hypothetical protein